MNTDYQIIKTEDGITVVTVSKEDNHSTRDIIQRLGYNFAELMTLRFKDSDDTFSEEDIDCFSKLFSDNVELVITRSPLTDKQIDKINEIVLYEWTSITNCLDLVVGRKPSAIFNAVSSFMEKFIDKNSLETMLCKASKEELYLHYSYFEEIFNRKCIDNKLQDCRGLDLFFNNDGNLVDYAFHPNLRISKSGIPVLTLDSYLSKYFDCENYLTDEYDPTVCAAEFLGYNISELNSYYTWMTMRDDVSEKLRSVCGLYHFVTGKLAYIIELECNRLTEPEIYEYLRIYNDQYNLEEYKLGKFYNKTIRQSYIENTLDLKSEDNKIKTDDYVLTFNDGYLYSYEERITLKKLLGKDAFRMYEDESFKFHADVNDIASELDCMAECLSELLTDKYSCILNSGSTRMQFSYSSLIVNYIALAAVFTDKDVTLRQFIDSTHGKYEYISRQIENGVEVVKIKAYGKIVKFYDGHTQQRKSIVISNEESKANSVYEGYVYALINPSMEGLVKIGKTTKDPKERAKELSSATGVATPFIVAYYRKFKNCNNAEKELHRYFEQKGKRYSSSREFFEIETHEAVEAISSLIDQE